MENNNGKGIFYGVIGVATLIVAIIGATFAYFTATTNSTQLITGTAATASLGVEVTRLTGHSAAEQAVDGKYSYVMVPQLDVGLSKAIRGVTDEKDAESNPANNDDACIDAGGSLVCSIYKIKVTNQGSAAIMVNGSIKFYATDTVYEETAEGIITGPTNELDSTKLKADGSDSKMNNLKWARLAAPTVGTMPDTLLTYSTDTTYTQLTDGTAVKYAATNSANIYNYAFTVAETVDLLGASKQNVTSHQAVMDLLDPSEDMTCAKVGETTNYGCTVSNTTNGLQYLAAAGQSGDNATFYIVVWISENNQSQNTTNKGSFTGQVTFNSMDGSGATSTFTEAYVAS